MTTEIYVLGKRVRLLQPDEGFRTSLDSVMLAASCPAKEGDRVVDMGCGVGGAGFCLLDRVPGVHVTGVELQADHADLARQNIALNKAEDRAAFITADIRDFTAPARFDHIICNPPYLEAGAHTPSPREKLATARGHADEEMSLKDWIDKGFELLESNGSICIIHRADQTDKILQGLGKRFGAIEIIPLWPRVGEAAKRVIVRAIKDRRSPATLHFGIVLHETDGSYTQQCERILRDGEPIVA